MREEIVSNAVLFFLAGYETTATTLNFILYELAINQGVQQKVGLLLPRHTIY